MSARVKKTTFFFLLLFFFFKGFAAIGGEIDDDLKSKLTGLHSDQFTSCLVVMKDQTNTAELNLKLNLQKAARATRHQVVLNSLKSTAFNSQTGLVDYLRKRNLEGSVREFKTFWITNAVLITATRSEIERIASRPDVEAAYENYPITLVDPVSIEETSGNTADRDRYLSLIGARDAWKMGYTGAGRIICSLDTGVDGDHPALVSNWRGNNGAEASACWFDPLGAELPRDLKGHGSHVMGIMAGVSETDTFGVAYGAQWISAAVIDRGTSLSQTIANIIAAFEWAVDPDGDPQTIDDVPDVVNNSWGVPSGFKPACDQTFWNAIDNVENAGIAVVFAAGNEGPEPVTLRTPSDRISSPTNCFSVGAIDPLSYGYPVANFSSRGPSGCDNQTIKPELCSPGVGIYSCYKGGEYRLMSGTSMSAPFVSAAVAILRQYNPDATVEQIKQAILESCSDLGPEGEDNSYGNGLINIKRALEILPRSGQPNLYLTEYYHNGGDVLDPGEHIDLVIQLKNSGVDIKEVVVELNSPDSLVSIAYNSFSLSSVTQGEVVSNSNSPFKISFDQNMPLGRQIELEIMIIGQQPEYLGELRIGLTVGGLPPLSIGDHDAGNFLFTVSNFGQYGLGNGSFNPLGGKGWVYPKEGKNRLYEASLLIGVGPDRVSDGARGEDGYVPEQDFEALTGGELSIQMPGAVSDQDGFCKFSDANAPLPLGVEISQRSFAYSDSICDDFLIIHYNIKNAGADPLEDAFVGLFFDWDISSISPDLDLFGFDADLSLYYQYDQENLTYLSLIPLSELPYFSTQIDNPRILYDGFSSKEKFDFLSGQISTRAYGEFVAYASYIEPEAKDWSQMISCGPISLALEEKTAVAFAIVGGGSLDELIANIAQARAKYESFSSSIEEQEEEEELVSPKNYSLGQNYPNPFNPATTIRFTVGNNQATIANGGESTVEVSPVQASLRVYNIRGQLVKTLVEGELYPGSYEVIWDGTDQTGDRVASGVYLYRLKTDKNQTTRRMILIK
jgi:subtilisin family serine protease